MWAAASDAKLRPMHDESRLGEPVSGHDARAPRRRPLDGRFVRLEPVDAARHAEPLWRAANDGSEEADRVWSYLPFGPFDGPAEMRSWAELCARSDDPLVFTVVSHASGPIGMTSFMSIDPAMRHLEVGGIWYAPAAQRTEANTEAAYLMLREAFEELGYRRVEWKCDTLNERSRAAALRLGFTFEGVFRRHMVVKGRNRDTAWFSVIQDEWPVVRDALERWLDADRADRPPLTWLRERSIRAE